MTHRMMTQLSPSDLNYEIAGSKKCLANHETLLLSPLFHRTVLHKAKNDLVMYLNALAEQLDPSVNTSCTRNVMTGTTNNTLLVDLV